MFQHTHATLRHTAGKALGPAIVSLLGSTLICNLSSPKGLEKCPSGMCPRVAALLLTTDQSTRHDSGQQGRTEDEVLPTTNQLLPCWNTPPLDYPNNTQSRFGTADNILVGFLLLLYNFIINEKEHTSPRNVSCRQMLYSWPL